jgi:hypothetical protein
MQDKHQSQVITVEPISSLSQIPINSKAAQISSGKALLFESNQSSGQLVILLRPNDSQTVAIPLTLFNSHRI